jgi:hypothetical protein
LAEPSEFADAIADLAVDDVRSIMRDNLHGLLAGVAT